jgi:hypothetical protein
MLQRQINAKDFGIARGVIVLAGQAEGQGGRIQPLMAQPFNNRLHQRLVVDRGIGIVAAMQRFRRVNLSTCREPDKAARRRCSRAPNRHTERATRGRCPLDGARQ